MNSPEDNLEFTLKINRQLRINVACERFEEQWKRGNTPEIVEFLNDCENSDRSGLLRELLSIDSHWRWLNNSKLSREDYEARLPNDHHVVHEFFNQSGSSLEQFINQMSDSGLLSNKKLQSILKSLPAANRPANPQELIEVLIQQEKLTSYQAQQLSQGTIKRLILGDYLIQDVIGAGGMGQVYLAEHRRMKRQVALKMLPDAIAEDSQSVLRFEREVRAAAKLSHPNIVAAYDAGEDNGLHYFVMEWVEGTDLSRLIKQNGKLPVVQAVNYVLQAARALEYAHCEGIIHRDIKPANIILDKKGTIKILDMGLARIDSSDDDNTRTGLTSTGMVMGTIDYMAPEQALDSKHADTRSDIYSLGCMLHYLLTGKVIYNGDTVLKKIFAHRDSTAPSLSATDAEIPFSLDAVFQKMVAKEPDDRQQSMTQVINELTACEKLKASLGSPLESDDFCDSAASDLIVEQQIGDISCIDPKIIEQTSADPFTVYSASSGETISGTRSLKWSMLRNNALPLRGKIISGVIVCLLTITGLAWTTGVFSPMNPAGTLILDVGQPGLTGATVSVDGQEKIMLNSGNSTKPIRIESVNQKHTLTVVKTGFKEFKKEFSVKPGETQKIRVQLELLNTEKKELLTTGLSPQENQPAIIDPQKQLVEKGLRNGLGIGYWTATGMGGFPRNSDEAPIPLERIAVTLIGIDSKYIKSGFEWEPFERVNSIFKITCNTSVPITTLQHLKGVTSLQLSNSQLTDRDVSYISEYPDLQSFIIYGNFGVTDASCDDIANISSLRELDINATGITGEGLKKLSALPSLYSLSLGLSKGIAASDLEHLRSCRSLKSLAIQSAEHDENLVEQLGSLSSLRVINLMNINMSEADITRLQKLLPECSVIHPSAPPYETDQQVAKWVIENNGSFSLHGSSHQQHLRLPQQPSYALDSIEIVGIDGQTMKSSQFDGLRSLEKLSLMKMTSSDNGLAMISNLLTLRFLAVSYSDVSSSGLEQIKDLNQLEALHLKGCWNLSDDALQQLASLTHLTTLGLDQTPLTNIGLKHVGKISGLQDLLLASCPNIGASGIEYLATLPKLRYLNLNSTPITDSAIPHLQKMKSLRVLMVCSAQITADGAKRLQAALPECVVFHESLEDVPWTGTPGFTDNLTGN